jgi:hypothetical protein
MRRAESPNLAQILAARDGLDGGHLFRLERPDVFSAFFPHHRSALALAVAAAFG